MEWFNTGEIHEAREMIKIIYFCKVKIYFKIKTRKGMLEDERFLSCPSYWKFCTLFHRYSLKHSYNLQKLLKRITKKGKIKISKLTRNIPMVSCYRIPWGHQWTLQHRPHPLKQQCPGNATKKKKRREKKPILMFCFLKNYK